MSSSPTADLRVRIAWGVLDVLLALETLLLGWVTVITLQATFTAGEQWGQSLSLVVMAAVALLWVGFTLVGAVRARPSWARGSALTIHVLLFAAGTGCLQLAIGSWQFGFGLIAAALVGFVAALLAKPNDPDAAEPEAYPETMPG